MVKRFEVYLVNLDPQPSDDAKLARPAVVISPDEMNKHLSHVLIAPIAALTDGKFPTRITTNLLNTDRSIILDQMRTVDKIRLVKKIGDIGRGPRKAVLACLAEMFAE